MPCSTRQTIIWVSEVEVAQPALATVNNPTQII